MSGTVCARTAGGGGVHNVHNSKQRRGLKTHHARHDIALRGQCESCFKTFPHLENEFDLLHGDSHELSTDVKDAHRLRGTNLKQNVLESEKDNTK